MIKPSVNDKEMQAALKKLSKEVGKTADDSVIELAKVGATQLAYRVQPFGLAKKSKDILERAIYKDISKAYWTTGRTYNEIKKINPRLAAAYAAAMNDGDSAKAEKIAAKVVSGFDIAPMDGGSHLERLRGRNGRVLKVQPVGVAEKADIEALKAKKALTGGTSKAGFLQAGLSLGSKGRVAVWLKKAARLGSSTVRRAGWKTVVTLTNHVRYASNVMSRTQQQLAIGNAYKNHLKRLKRQLDALAKKF